MKDMKHTAAVLLVPTVFAWGQCVSRQPPSQRPVVTSPHGEGTPPRAVVPTPPRVDASSDDTRVAPTELPAEIPDYLAAQRPQFHAARAFRLAETPLTETQFYQRPWLWGQSGIRTTAVSTEGINEVDRGTPESRVRAIAEQYLQWGRLDDELRWAPFLCRQPQPSVPSQGRGRGPHGQKVYFLYARTHNEYMRQPPFPTQVIVKEAWVPQEIDAHQAVHLQRSSITTQQGTKTYQPGTFAGLFVMFRARPQEPRAASDQGWLYGTVTPSGEIHAGRIESCIECHRSAPRGGRLFGLPQRRPH